jgi:acetate kinase
MEILVINAGSSSVKFSLFDFESLRPIARGLLDWAGDARRAMFAVSPEDGEKISRELDAPDYRAGVIEAMKVLADLEFTCGEGCSSRRLEIGVVGHRLIHGGEEIRQPVRIDAEMKKTIEGVAHLAPLHIPAGLQAIEAAEDALPEAIQIGLFDTAFFGDIPPCVYLYPVPYEWYEEWGIRRFGFHGISHAYCTGRAAEMMGLEVPIGRLIICHLGQGASATALREGKAVTNTMGFTPLEGLMMGTRSGTVDPGLLLYVQREHGLSVDRLDDILHRESGLLGISGVSSDFRQVEAAAAEGHQRAQLALDVYAYRVRAVVGALAVSIGGIDALVFTGGIGENSSWLRRQVCDGLECLGVYLDQEHNKNAEADTDIAERESSARVLVIHTREDLMIAREARQLMVNAR